MRISDWSSDVCSSDLCAYLRFRDDHVILAEGNTRLERVAETQRHDGVGKQHRVLLTRVAIDLIDYVANVLLGEKAVDDIERNLVVLWQAFANQHATRRSLEPLDRKSVVKGRSVSVGVETGGAG